MMSAPLGSSKADLKNFLRSAYTPAKGDNADLVEFLPDKQKPLKKSHPAMKLRHQFCRKDYAIKFYFFSIIKRVS